MFLLSDFQLDTRIIYVIDFQRVSIKKVSFYRHYREKGTSILLRKHFKKLYAILKTLYKGDSIKSHICQFG